MVPICALAALALAGLKYLQQVVEHVTEGNDVELPADPGN